MPIDRDRESTFAGQWWLPEDPGRTFFGTLAVGPTLDLELFESVESRSSWPPGSFNPPVLLGRSSGRCLTLLDNYESSVNISESAERGDIRRMVRVGTALVGDSHIANAADCRFNWASFRLTNLDAWVNRSPYDWTVGDSNSISFIELPLLEASVPGCRIGLSRGYTKRLSALGDSGFSSRETITLRLEERLTLEEIEYRYIRPLSQLLTLATCTHTKSSHLELGEDAGDTNESLPESMLTVRRSESDFADDGAEMIRQRMRFGMNAQGYAPNVDFDTVIVRWFEIQAQLSDVCDLIFSLRGEVTSYLEQQAFTVASAIETLHRRRHLEMEEMSASQRERFRRVVKVLRGLLPAHYEWVRAAIGAAHRPSYAERVRGLLEETDHIMALIVGDEERWLRALRDVRNGIGHVLTSKDSGNFHRMIAVFTSAQLFAEVVLLKELGFTDSDCRLIVRRNRGLDSIRSMVMSSFPDWFAADSA